MTEIVETGSVRMSGSSRILKFAPVLMLMTLAVACFAASARADFGIKPGTFVATATDDAGNVFTQAGAHPDATTSFLFNEVTDANGVTQADEDAKEIRVDLPAGLVGDPHAVPRCPQYLFNSNRGAPSCPAETQVGVVTIFNSRGYTDSTVQRLSAPVYNLDPPGDKPASFGFSVLRVNVVISADVRADGDYGITATVKDLPGGFMLHGSSLTLWGVPADQAHDAQRYRPTYTDTGPGDENGNPLASTAPRRALMIAPTSCGGPVVTRIAVRSWQHPERWVHDEATSPPVTGCDRLRFDPSLSLASRAPKVAAPSGYDVGLSFRQPEDPAGFAPAQLKDAVVTLPAGALVNPSSADGLQACGPQQILLKSKLPATCPDGSKIGTVDIETPLLDQHLTGSVYLADPTPSQLISLYIVAQGAGITVKLAGTVDPDPVTGQLKTTFVNNPQVPVSHISLSLKDGPRSPLSNPRACGPATTNAALTPWNGMAAVQVSSTFMVSGDGNGGPCPARRFAPAFASGVENADAAAYSPFTTSFSREDGDEFLKGISLKLPKGLLARISSLTPCAEAEAQAGSCPDGSRIGRVTASAGAGALPFQLPGRVYVTGPYKGGPFGLSIVVPAVAGPFDLGDVVVRAAIYVDPVTAELSVVSDPLPAILEGIPLQIRAADVVIDRPGFVFNPSDCTAKSVGAELTSAAGDAAPVGSRFQVGNCAGLDLAPKLGITLSGKGQTTDGKHPAVAATLTQPAGDANLKKVRVALPLSLALDPDNAASDDLCSFIEGSKPDPKCPKSSIVGTATAVTPVLHEPLTGPVYFVKNERKDPKSGRSIRTTPKLVIPLTGENGIKLTLTGTSTVANNQLVTTFDDIPDAPVSSFKLSINGGKKGILVVSGADICKATQIAGQQIDGQNNKHADTKITIQTPGCPLKVISKKTAATTVTVKAGGLSAGKVTLTGHGIKKTTRTIATATVATITAARTTGTTGKVTVSFDPTGPAKARKTTK